MDCWRNLLNKCSVKQLFLICLLCGIVYFTAHQIKCHDVLKWESSDIRHDTSLRYVYNPNCTTQSDREYEVDERKRFPTSIVIGVKKGGTRALLNMLEAHPDIVSAHREMHYFDYEENFKRGVEYYIDQMPVSRPGQITIEKSPHYFVTKYVPLRMAMVSPNLKLILIVRDPVSRLISDYTQLDSKKVVKNVKRQLFEEAVLLKNGSVNTDYVPVQVGLYSMYFKNWLEHFPLDQILVVDGGNFISNPYEELKRVEEFLQLKSYYQESQFFYSEEKGFYCWKTRRKTQPQCLGDKKGRTHPNVPDHVMEKLKNYYKSSNEEFYRLTHKNFNW